MVNMVLIKLREQRMLEGHCRRKGASLSDGGVLCFALSCSWNIVSAVRVGVGREIHWCLSQPSTQSIHSLSNLTALARPSENLCLHFLTWTLACSRRCAHSDALIPLHICPPASVCLCPRGLLSAAQELWTSSGQGNQSKFLPIQQAVITPSPTKVQILGLGRIPPSKFNPFSSILLKL